jgi:hypothetical protein
MQFEQSVSTTTTTSSSSLNNSDVENRRSFLSLDVDGRVVRLDSFSKVLSAGNFQKHSTTHVRTKFCEI